MKRISMVLVVVGVLAAVGVRAQDQARLLRDAINKETVDGDCKGAIEQYRKVAAGSDRALAAQALLRMADCHQKLGNAEATRIYQQIISSYSTQPEAGQARQRLSAMSTVGSPRSGKGDRIVWTTPSAAESPLAVSEDGQRLVYAEGVNLILYEFNNGGTRPLTHALPGDMSDDNVSFSRDGKQLAFMWFNKKDDRDELRVLSVDGPATQAGRPLIASPDILYAEPYNWTADGQWVSVVIDRPDRSSQLALVSARNGSVRVLQSFEASKSIGGVAISPDDRFVAFNMSDGSSNSDVFVIGMDGSGAAAVVQHRARDRVLGWTADGTRLVFTSDRSGTQDIMTLPVRDGRATGPAQSLQLGFDRSSSLGLTSTGSLYYTKRGGQPVSDVKIAGLDPRTGQLTSPMTDLVKEYVTGSVQAPDFSPDNKSIAYIVEPAEEIRHDSVTLAIRSLENGSVRELTVKLRTISWLRWSPDGSALVAFGTSEVFSHLWRIDATSGALTLIAKFAPKAPIGFITWSADSRKVAYRRSVSGSTEVWLYEYDVMSGSERELLHIPADSAVADPRISPDWRTIYYRRAIADGGVVPFQIFAFIARDIATGTERELIRRNLGGTNLSVDGRSLVTGSNDPATQTRSIILIPVDGGPVRDLMRIDLPQPFLDRKSLVNPLGVFKQPPGDVVILSKDFGTGTTVERSEYWWAPIDGRPMKLLDLGAISELRMTSDGRRIAIMPTQPRERNPVEVHVLERFLPVK